MEPYEIVIIVIASIVGLWLLLFFVDLIFVLGFFRIFKKHKKAITVVLYTKLENMRKLFSVMKQSGIKIDDRLVKVLNEVNENDFADPSSAEFDKSKNALSYLKDEIMFLANQYPDLNSNIDFIQAKNNISESDLIYRNNVTMYNADVLGYNYWISFVPCGFIFKLFKLKKKQIIS